MEQEQQIDYQTQSEANLDKSFSQKRNWWKTAFILTFFTLVVLVALIKTGFFEANKTNKSSDINPNPSPIPITVVISTVPEETTSWKTYSSEKFSFRYPASWQKPQTCKFGKDICVVSPDIQESPIDFGDGGGTVILKKGGAFGVTLTKKTAEMKLEEVCKPGGSVYIQSCQPEKVSGKNGMRRIEGKPEHSTTIFVMDDDYLYSINMSYADDNGEMKTLLEKIFSTFVWLPYEESSSSWIRRQFNEAWDIEYPEGWRVNEAGLLEGNLILEGEFENNFYNISLSYPIGLGYISGPPQDLTLLGWIEHELSFLPDTQKKAVEVKDTLVAGAQAKKVLGIPDVIYDDGAKREYSSSLTHRVYIWQNGDKKQRIIILKQTSGEFDSYKAEKLLDRLIKGIR